MANSPIKFDVVYSQEIAADAAHSFRDYRFKRYGRLMIAACIVNAIGLSTALWFGAQPRAVSTLFLYVLVIGSPMWLLYEHFVWPRRHVSRLLRLLPSPNRVSIGTESVSVTTQRGEAAIPWSRVKRVVETQSAFLLVLSPFLFLFIPLADVPVEAREALRGKVA